MNINEIIKSEYQQMLNESDTFKDNKLNFNQRIINSTFMNYESFSEEFDPEIVSSDIIVNWNLSFWVNESGIENMNIEVSKLSGSFSVELRNKQTDAVEQTNDKDINLIPWKFEVENGVLQVGGSLYVKTVSFDFATKVCSISF